MEPKITKSGLGIAFSEPRITKSGLGIAFFDVPKYGIYKKTMKRAIPRPLLVIFGASQDHF